MRATTRTIEVARDALYTIRMNLNDAPVDEECVDKLIAWHTLKNFIDLVEKDVNEHNNLKRRNDMMWYAVMMDKEDNDWGYGSYDQAEAMRMMYDARKNDYPDAYIAVIAEGDDPICVCELHYA